MLHVKDPNSVQDSILSVSRSSTSSSSGVNDLNDTQLSEKIVEAMMRYYRIQEKEEIWRFLHIHSNAKPVTTG